MFDKSTTRGVMAIAALAGVISMISMSTEALAKKKKKVEAAEDKYAEYVWPPPPDEARIRLVDVIRGRIDVEATSNLKRKLLGATPGSPYDRFAKPFGVEIDSGERILVTDSANASLLRFDLVERRMDVFGTQGAIRLRTPLGLTIGTDDTAFVADVGLRKIVAIDTEGNVRAAYGKEGELTNPTDAALAPDGKRLFVADSRAEEIVIFDLESAKRLSSFGQRGGGDGEFRGPTSLAFDADGNLLVVDQLNARVQMFTMDGEHLDTLGGRGVGFGNLVRPKDVAVDGAGFIYVTDNAFNNVQIFDADFSLLTFVGAGGTGPGMFHGASGVAARGDVFAVVDQLGRRLQVFRYLESRGGG